MSLPKFDPRSFLEHRPARAYRAYCAYLAGQIGTSGTIGTVIESNLGLRPYRLVADSWRGKLIAARAACRNATEHRCLDAALALSLSPWLSRLLELGWDESALFVFDAANPRHGGLVQALPRGTLIAATAEAAYLVTQAGRERHIRRSPAQTGGPLIWSADTRHGGINGY